MQLLGLIATRSGYAGFVVEHGQYVYFKASGRQLRRLQAYEISSFEDYDHFIGLMSRFFPLTAFYNPPIPVSGLTLAELDRVFGRSCEKPKT